MLTVSLAYTQHNHLALHVMVTISLLMNTERTVKRSKQGLNHIWHITGALLPVVAVGLRV